MGSESLRVTTGTTDPDEGEAEATFSHNDVGAGEPTIDRSKKKAGTVAWFVAHCRGIAAAPSGSVGAIVVPSAVAGVTVPTIEKKSRGTRSLSEAFAAGDSNSVAPTDATAAPITHRGAPTGTTSFNGGHKYRR